LKQEDFLHFFRVQSALWHCRWADYDQNRP